MTDTAENGWLDISVAPDPSGTLKAIQNAGYTFESAIADLIDNSIQAGATNIEILLTEGSQRLLTIEDNGNGLTRDQLIDAMRVAGTSSLVRQENDYGYFGVGLKAAALYLSASGHMEVDTWTGRDTGGRTGWDINSVAETGWTLRIGPTQRLKAGTDVVIHDPRVPDSEENGVFLACLAESLGLTFAPLLRKGLRILIQGTSVEPHDPCDPEHEGVRRLGMWPLPEGRGSMTLISVPPGGLPEETPQACRAFSGIHLRRAGRAVTTGGWMKVMPANQHSEQLNRLRMLIDIPMDEIDTWQIGVAKSSATVPSSLIPRIRERVLDGLRRTGHRTTPKRSTAQLPGPGVSPWLPDGTLNRQHPAIQAAFNSPSRSTLEEMLKAIERMT